MSSLQRLGRQLAEEEDALRQRSGVRAAVREQLMGARLRPARKTHVLGARGVRLPLAGGALCGIAGALALWLAYARPSPLSLRVGSHATRVYAGAWLEAPAGHGELGLQFSDGTRIGLAPGTRARVVEIDARGAHLLLESGRAHVAVKHHPSTAYRLSVGPFLVRVIGTRFDVRWDPERDQLGVDLRAGRVELSGCVFGAGYRLHAGQRVAASCRRGRVDVGAISELPHAAADGARSSAAAAGAEQRAPGVAESATDASRAAAAERDPGRAPAADAPPATTDSEGGARSPRSAERASSRARAAVGDRATTDAERALLDWRTLGEHGRYAAALAAARAAGFDAECARASADDLALLADAARYAGHRGFEVRALRLLRRRFAGTSRAALAAFALGRLEFDEHHAYAKAARWFDTYLREQPGGALSREAGGRLIEAALAAGERDWARAVAADYLRDYPAGPYAGLARRLVRAPAPARADGSNRD